MLPMVYWIFFLGFFHECTFSGISTCITSRKKGRTIPWIPKQVAQLSPPRLFLMLVGTAQMKRDDRSGSGPELPKTWDFLYEIHIGKVDSFIFLPQCGSFKHYLLQCQLMMMMIRGFWCKFPVDILEILDCCSHAPCRTFDITSTCPLLNTFAGNAWPSTFIGP